MPLPPRPSPDSFRQAVPEPCPDRRRKPQDGSAVGRWLWREAAGKCVFDGADGDIDRTRRQKQRVGGDGVGRGGFQPLFIKRCAGIDALVHQMHGCAEVTAVLFHKRPITAHLAAIGRVDTGVEIDDRAAEGTQCLCRQKAAGNGEDHRRFQHIGGLAAFLVIERGKASNGNVGREVCDKTVLGDDLTASSGGDTFAKPGSDHRRHLAESNNPAEPPRPSLQNGRFAFRLFQEHVNIRELR
ncbi:hypothetical protein AT6N2_C0498 [Agrobacterium tumefaciens]|nr:hypothetical protein AT6N2_C0498 [Agrobacterium tumefaciens]